MMGTYSIGGLSIHHRRSQRPEVRTMRSCQRPRYTTLQHTTLELQCCIAQWRVPPAESRELTYRTALGYVPTVQLHRRASCWCRLQVASGWSNDDRAISPPVWPTIIGYLEASWASRLWTPSVSLCVTMSDLPLLRLVRTTLHTIVTGSRANKASQRPPAQMAFLSLRVAEWERIPAKQRPYATMCSGRICAWIPLVSCHCA
ncbi:hypothetical protein GGR50DRAFT_1211 [Xylaria sp. CBS 124048]|nr:hypothetical protein GGR50DRAFT_1211 [Xylaria sp. CBS 124048]